MMRTREQGGRKPCTHCGTPTSFERVFQGKRGAQHTEPCCCPCGEQKDAER